MTKALYAHMNNKKKKNHINHVTYFAKNYTHKVVGFLGKPNSFYLNSRLFLLNYKLNLK
jgi:hypothetical protein